MEYRSFEDDLAKKLHDASHPVDIDALIASIHQEEKPKKRAWMLFSSLLFIGLSSGLVGYYLMTKDNDSNGSSKSLSANTQVATNTETTFESGLSSQRSTLDLSTNQNYNNSENLVNTKTENITTIAKTKSNTTNTFTNVQNQLGTRSHRSSSAIISLGSENQENIQSNKSSTSTSAITSSSAATQPIFENTTESKLHSIESTQVNEGLSTSTPNNHQHISSINLLPYHLQLLELQPRKLAKFKKIVCPPFGNSKKGFAFSIIPEVGVYYPIKSLAPNNADSTSTYVNRASNEKSLEGLAGSLYLRMQARKLPFYVQLGGAYHRHTERMDYTYDYKVTDTVRVLLSVTLSQAGDTLKWVYGRVPRETQVTGNKIVHHNFTMIDIPFGVGYKYNLGRINIGLEAGILANIAVKGVGRLLDDNNTFTAIDALPKETFRPSLGLQYYGGIAAYLPSGKHGEFFASTRYRYIPKSFTGPVASIHQRYQFTGLYFGYVHYLNN